MQLGYLTKEGYLVSFDTLGNKTLYKAFQIDERAGSIRFLTLSRTLEPLGDIFVTVVLHRTGWVERGETILRRTKARLYRTRTQHVIIGHNWKRIKPLSSQATFWFGRAALAAPLLWPRPVYGKVRVFPPGRKFPFIVTIPDRSVRACKRTENKALLYATEQKEFTEFVLGKLSVLIEFAGVKGAETFARNYPTIEESSSIDPSVTVDVDRSKKAVKRRRKFMLLGLLAVGIAGTFSLALFLAILLRSQVIGNASIPVIIFLVFAMISVARGFRQEQQDLLVKWPRDMFAKWASEFELRAASFPRVAKELGVTVEPEKSTLAPLDEYIRRLPPDTFHGAFALDTAGVVGALLLGRIGRQVKFEWRYYPPLREQVLFFETINLFVTPASLLRSVWVNKDPMTLDRFVETWARKIQLRLAFALQPELIALGFLDNLWEKFDEFAARVEADLSKAPAVPKRLGDDRFNLRRPQYGPFEIQFAEVEKERFGRIPTAAVPYCNVFRKIEGRLEASSPRSPLRDDVAIVRLQGMDLVPLGFQIYNYLDIGAGFTKKEGTLELEVAAFVDNARVLGPRIREQISDSKDAIFPLTFAEGGLPVTPYARFLGRIASVEETSNPFRNIPFWKIGLDIGELNLESVVRKDKCDGIPQVGHHLAGTVWLVGKMPVSQEETSEYIR